jgi:aminoglycoside 3-N-acetyltransferase
MQDRGNDGCHPVESSVMTEWLVRDLRRLGVSAGQTLLVHASLSAIGWVNGGAATVIAALAQAVGETGNVVVSTGTEENSQTSRAYRERTKHMTPGEARQYRRDMPAFDRDTTPTSAGAIAEELRTTGGAFRSAHPQSSFAAIGPKARYLMANHPLECHLGERSPLARLYELDAQILLIGVGYRSCTAFHLAEYRYTLRPPRQWYSCVVTENDRRKWKKYRDVVLDDGDFGEIGKSLDDDESLVKKGYVGNAESRLLSLVKSVDEAVKWMQENRGRFRIFTRYGTSKNRSGSL